MPKRPSLALRVEDETAPIPETAQVLTALELLPQVKRITVLSAAIAFYGIGNGELNTIK